MIFNVSEMNKTLIHFLVFMLFWVLGCYFADYVFMPEARSWSMFIGAVTYMIGWPISNKVAYGEFVR